MDEDFDLLDEATIQDEDEDDILEEIDIAGEEEIQNKEIKNKTTMPIMNVYEMSNLISERVEQLDNNYKTTLDKETLEKKNLYTSYDIAMEEFNQKVLPPFVIKRILPNKKYELWSFKEFKFFPK